MTSPWMENVLPYTDQTTNWMRTEYHTFEAARKKRRWRVIAWSIVIAMAIGLIPLGWWAQRCNCKDVRVLGHNITTGRIGGGQAQLLMEGIDEYNGERCMRWVTVGQETFRKTNVGDSLHFKKDPL